MSVNWLWKSEKGEFVYKCKDGEFKGEKFKVGMYGGNCLCAHIYRFKKLNEQTGKKEKYYNFWGFWNDIEHLKNCLGMNPKKGYKDDMYKDDSMYQLVKIRVNAFYPEMMKVAELFAKAGYKVEVFYKKTR